jgi:hypothetical protein
LRIDNECWNIIDFQPVGDISYSSSIAVGMRNDDDLVPTLNQPLGQAVQVTFYTTHIGVEKVGHHTTTWFSMRRRAPTPSIVPPKKRCSYSPYVERHDSCILHSSRHFFIPTFVYKEIMGFGFIAESFPVAICNMSKAPSNDGLSYKDVLSDLQQIYSGSQPNAQGTLL